MLSDIFRSALTILSPKLNTEVVFFFKFHRRINWKNPQTLNEKILKLKLDSYGSDPSVRRQVRGAVICGGQGAAGYVDPPSGRI